MLKKISLVLALSFPATAMASGTIPFSLSQQLDALGKPLANCFFYTIQAGTTSTPQNAYQDSALTLALPNPMRCDAAGRLPQFFLADGLIKIRIADKNGVSQAYPNGAAGIDNIQVIGPSGGGGGGGGTIDPTTIAATGDFKSSFTTDVLTGWVRANGRTIGSSTSGATERANSDTQALFTFLWPQTQLAVSGGRGANAAADWAANKTIALPDLRGRAVAGLDDMGGSDSGRLGAGLLASCRLSLGCAGGEATHALTVAETPNITSNNPTQAISVFLAGNNTAAAISGGFTVTSQNFSAGGPLQVPAISGTAWGGQNNSTGNNNITVASTGTGGTSPTHNNIQPTILVTSYIKL